MKGGLSFEGGMIQKESRLDESAPIVMAYGMNGVGLHQTFIVMDGEERDVAENEKSGKPSYRVPSMDEIVGVPWNGFKVVSTFTGAGGSCLGFRMAGFKTVWASEFVPAAAEVYRLNFPDIPINTRDIRNVSPEDVLREAGLERGEADVLEGSPPCTSFSTAGKREKSWGKVTKYSDTRQRSDDLFFEFVRIVEGVQPKVFVAENVSGLVKGKAKGYFKNILKAMKGIGYDVKAKLLDAQWLGVPQMRRRLIFVGVRSDLEIAPVFPKPLPYRYSVRDALPWIEYVGIKPTGTYEPKFVDGGDNPCPTILSGETGGAGLVKARVIHDTSGLHSIGDVTDRPSPTITAQGRGHLFVLFDGEKYYDPDTGQEIGLAEHVIGDEWEKLEPGMASKKYFNLCRLAADKPSSTITGIAGQVGAAGVTHPVHKRKLTIGELKRLGAFPDDFRLTGSYSQRWERIGKSVPPLMMKAIAEVVRDGILGKIVS